jgi:hypothetical protein
LALKTPDRAEQLNMKQVSFVVWEAVKNFQRGGVKFPPTLFGDPYPHKDGNVGMDPPYKF